MKYILTALAFAFSLSAHAQLQWCTVQSSDVAALIPTSQASGVGVVSPLCSIGGDTCIMEFTVALEPAEAMFCWDQTDESEVAAFFAFLSTPQWNNTDPELVTGKSRIEIFRTLGNDLADDLLATLNDITSYDHAPISGGLTPEQANAIYLSYDQSLTRPSAWTLIREGLLDQAYQNWVDGLYVISPPATVGQANTFIWVPISQILQQYPR